MYAKVKASYTRYNADSKSETKVRFETVLPFRSLEKLEASITREMKSQEFIGEDETMYTGLNKVSIEFWTND